MAPERLREIDEGIWTVEGDPIRFATFPYTLRSTVVDLCGRALWVHSPAQLEAMGDIVRSLGPRAATPRNYRSTFWRRFQARRAVREIVAWEQRRVIVTHGPCIEEDVPGFLEQAFRWLL